MKCPKCQTDFTPTGAEIARELGRRTSAKKTAACRANGRRGGRPRKKQEEK